LGTRRYTSLQISRLGIRVTYTLSGVPEILRGYIPAGGGRMKQIVERQTRKSSLRGRSYLLFRSRFDDLAQIGSHLNMYRLRLSSYFSHRSTPVLHDETRLDECTDAATVESEI
jgi:hypothetical protein